RGRGRRRDPRGPAHLAAAGGVRAARADPRGRPGRVLPLQTAPAPAGTHHVDPGRAAGWPVPAARGGPRSGGGRPPQPVGQRVPGRGLEVRDLSMPELPEVETVRQGLARWVAGRTIASAEVHHPRAIRRHLPGESHFTALLAGRKIMEIRRRGKYLWLPLDS